jgi:hypothetical protein
MANPDDDDFGFSADLLGPSPSADSLAGSLFGGASTQDPPPPSTSPRLTGANVQLLGRILTSECGEQGPHACTPQEIQAIGSTVINRMDDQDTDDVSDVATTKGVGQFAMDKEPSQGMLFTAHRLLSGQLGDNTDGALNFYSPRSMPLENQPKKGDTSGGLEYVPGVGRKTTLQNYRPGWANELQQRTIPGVRDWYLKVYGLS